MRRPLTAAILVAGLLGAAGCTSGVANPALSDGTARQLQGDVLFLTQSAAAHNWAAAKTGLDKLSTDLAAARSAGTVSAVRGAAIEAALVAVKSDIAAAVAPTRPAPSISTTATPPTVTPPTVTPPSSQPKQKPTKTKKHGGDGGDGGH